VEKKDREVGTAPWWTQRLDGGEVRLGVAGVVGDEPREAAIGDRQRAALDLVLVGQVRS
jgi:hypothetical protein